MRPVTMRSVVLPPDVFDTFELSCEAYGGIGGYVARNSEGVPLCLVGHAWDADPESSYCNSPLLVGLGGGFNNDRVLEAALGREVLLAGARVSWKRYCQLRNIQRGKREVDRER